MQVHSVAQQILDASEDLTSALDVIAEETGLVILGIGRGRVGLALDDRCVAKLPWNDTGHVDNHIEWSVWQRCSGQLRNMLAGPFALDEKNVLLQERCLPVSCAGAARADHLIRCLAEYGITDTRTNLGIDADGALVCYDYAYISPSLYEQLVSTTRVRP